MLILRKGEGNSIGEGGLRAGQPSVEEKGESKWADGPLVTWRSWRQKCVASFVVIYYQGLIEVNI